MSEGQVFPVPPEWAARAQVKAEDYDAALRRIEADPEGYWGDFGRRLDWIKPFARAKDVSFTADDFHIRWYEGGVLNACANCLDRHLAKRGDATAFIWEGDDPAHSRRLTYREVHAEVCRMANVLKAHGVGKSARVTIYLPMILEAAFAMLACARIGAVHSVIFGGFSPESIAGRIQDCASRIVITADEGMRGGRIVPLKANVDQALEACPEVDRVLVVRRTGAGVAMRAGRDFAYEAWCTADVGWVTGLSYIVYGPLANGATSLIFEGVPNYPSVSRFWEVIDKHQVEIFYTAPTALRALMRDGDGPVRRTSRKSLRLLGTVGEPINPEAWLWYHHVVGEGRCPIVDTWWQTETGGALIAPLPGATPLKPGSATRPLPGVKLEIVDAGGGVLDGAASGNLVITDSWPGQMRTVYGDHPRFISTYFTTYPGKYFTGDGCRRDEDGYYWITGRVDDVINVSGHRLGTAEIESALVAHHAVAEAAVVGFPHDIKGQGIYAFVTLKADQTPTEALRAELVKWVRAEIGPFAAPDAIQWAPALPKTRSGKIMRRILRKVAEGDVANLGDTTTLADPSAVDDLVMNRVGG